MGQLEAACSGVMHYKVGHAEKSRAVPKEGGSRNWNGAKCSALQKNEPKTDDDQESSGYGSANCIFTAVAVLPFCSSGNST